MRGRADASTAEDEGVAMNCPLDTGNLYLRGWRGLGRGPEPPGTAPSPARLTNINKMFMVQR
jgi:hypothetical protein